MRTVRWALMAAALANGAAAADLVDATDPEAVAEMVRGYGYRAEMAVDGVGDPMIRTAAEGVESEIYFFGCEGGGDCRQILFRVGFDLPDGSDLATVNDWNRDRLLGRAYLDREADPILEHLVVLEGGVSQANLRAVLRLWGAAVSAFREHVRG